MDPRGVGPLGVGPLGVDPRGVGPALREPVWTGSLLSVVSKEAIAWSALCGPGVVAPRSRMCCDAR